MTIDQATDVILQLERDQDDTIFVFFGSKEEDKFTFYRNDNLDFADALVIIQGLLEKFGIHPLAIANMDIPSEAESLEHSIAMLEEQLKKINDLKNDRRGD